MEDSLRKICEDIIIILKDLKRRNIISDKELKGHLRVKLEYLKQHKK